MTIINLSSDILKEKEYTFVDLHHHSTISDGNRTPEFLARHFSKMNIGLSLTDHNDIAGSVYLSKQKNLLSIPGIEVTSAQAKDILGYFYSINDLKEFWEKEIKNKRKNNYGFNLHRTTIDTYDLIDKIHDYNGLASLAHPLTLKPKKSYSLLNDNTFLKKIDAIECFNYVDNHGKEMLLRSPQFNKPLTAGTDSHIFSLFNSLTFVPFPADTSSFLDALRQNKHGIFMHEKSFSIRRIQEALMVTKNNIKLWPFSDNGRSIINDLKEKWCKK